MDSLSVCRICNGEGYYKNRFGVKERCRCRIIPKDKEIKERVTLVDLNLLKDREMYNKLIQVIPESRLKDEYSHDYYRYNVEMQLINQGYKLSNEEEYVATLTKLLNEASLGEITESYLISAPNSFGKTTFIHTIMKRLLLHNRAVVPYIDLSSLAKLRLSYNESVYFLTKSNIKKEILDFNGFNWEDYLKADFVAVKLTDYESSLLEGSVLNRLVVSRGERGLPTIVTTNMPVAGYLGNRNLKQLYWDDILVYNSAKKCKDRLKIVSTSRKNTF